MEACDIDLSTEITRSVAGKTVTRIRIGTIYPATVGVLPAFLGKAGCPGSQQAVIEIISFQLS